MESKERIYIFDLLKFVASILIVFHHFQQTFGCKFGIINFYDGKFAFGYLVELFFMISGYCMLLSFEEDRNKSFRLFFLKRAIRIYPMAMISILAMLFLEFACRIIAGDWFVASPGIWRIITSLLLIPCGGAVQIDDLKYIMNSPTWYLSILVICNIIYWICIQISKKYKIRIEYLFAIMALVGIATKTYGIEAPFFNEYSARGYIPFFIGTLLYEICNSENIPGKILITLSALLFMLGVTTYCFAFSLWDDFELISIFLFYMPILILSVKSDILKRSFNCRFIRFLGAISYEIYLWHMPVFRAVFIIAFSCGITITDYALTMIAVSLGIVLLASCMYMLVEKPMTVKLKRLLF